MSRYGRWTVIGPATRTAHRNARVLCRCDCGTESIVAVSNLKSGGSTQCAQCRQRDNAKRNTRHGEGTQRSQSPEYRAWCLMITRCTNPRRQKWANYGGRGITVCERWRNSFEAFLVDVGRKPSPQHSLDRFPDNDGNYEPGNVRWATPVEQARNRRPRRRAAVAA